MAHGNPPGGHFTSCWDYTVDGKDDESSSQGLVGFGGKKGCRG